MTYRCIHTYIHTYIHTCRIDESKLHTYILTHELARKAEAYRYDDATYIHHEGQLAASSTYRYGILLEYRTYVRTYVLYLATT